MKKPTKELLAQAFYDLSRNKSIDKITVQNITQSAGFSHPTFYNHFQDKYDLLVWMYELAAHQLFDTFKSGEKNWHEMVSDGVGGYIKNRDFALNAFSNTRGNDSFLEHVARINSRILADFIKERQGKELTAEALGILKVYCYGSVHFIYQWLQGRVPLKQDQLISIIEQSMPLGVDQYFK